VQLYEVGVEVGDVLGINDIDGVEVGEVLGKNDIDEGELGVGVGESEGCIVGTILDSKLGDSMG